MQWTGFTDRQQSLPLIIFNEGGIKVINIFSSQNIWQYLTTELGSDVGCGVQAEQLLPVTGYDPSLAVRHRPLTGDGQGGPLDLEPVQPIRVSDRAVLSGQNLVKSFPHPYLSDFYVSREAEEFFPELEDGEAGPEIHLTPREDGQPRGMACDMVR